MSKIISSGKLICLVTPETERGITGMLLDPPKLAVVWWDYEHDTLKMERISWHAAQALAPEDMRAISEQWQMELAAAEKARAMKTAALTSDAAAAA